MSKSIKNIFIYAGLMLLGAILLIIADQFSPIKALNPIEWESAGPVAVGDGYSIILQTRHSHPFLAEYDQRLFVFSGDERTGKLEGIIDLHANTGGRTHLLAYSFRDPAVGMFIQFEDRFGDHALDLKDLKYEPYYPKIRQKDGIKFIGTFSKDAPPLKFIPPHLLPEAQSREMM